jgi:hypothetical protein
MRIEDEKKIISKYKKVYIQRLDGEFVNDASFYYYHGFKQLGIEVEFFDEDKKYLIPLSKDSLIVAGVPTTVRAFRMMGIEVEPLDIPFYLSGYTGRMVENTTICRALLNPDIKYPLFVKPVQGKLFNGQVVGSKSELEMFRYCDEINDINTKIIISEPVTFLAEYRIFVLDGKILDSKKYMGSYKLIPDYEIVEKAIADYKNAPIAYSIDFGVTDDGRTLLVECNDAYSLGPYGLNNMDLTRMFILRWNQILDKALILSNL